MSKTIYIIVKKWHGSLVEFIEAHDNETAAREAASKLISFTEPFFISIHTCELK